MPSFVYNIGVFASVGDSSIITPFACSKALLRTIQIPTMNKTELRTYMRLRHLLKLSYLLQHPHIELFHEPDHKKSRR